MYYIHIEKGVRKDTLFYGNNTQIALFGDFFYLNQEVI